MTRMFASSGDVMTKAQEQGWGYLGDILTTYADGVRAGDAPSQTVKDISVLIANSPAIRYQQLKQEGETDARKLAVIYTTDPKAFDRIYGNMVRYVG